MIPAPSGGAVPCATCVKSRRRKSQCWSPAFRRAAPPRAPSHALHTFCYQLVKELTGFTPARIGSIVHCRSPKAKGVPKYFSCPTLQLPSPRGGERGDQRIRKPSGWVRDAIAAPRRGNLKWRDCRAAVLLTGAFHASVT